MDCLYCQRKLTVFVKILNGAFCGSDHREAYLEALNRIGLARLVEARARMEKQTTGEQGAQVQSDSFHDELRSLEQRFRVEPSNGSRVLRRLKTESTQLLHELA